MKQTWRIAPMCITERRKIRNHPVAPHSTRTEHLSSRNHKICWNDNQSFMSIPAHIVASLQNLLIAQQALENALADISEPNKQTVQRVVEIIKKEILLLAEQYPIIKDFTSLPGINVIPAINLLLLL